MRGDPRQVDATALALPGHDAVLSAIGPHPRDALLGPSTLVADCARATVDAMTASGVGRLAIVTLVTRLCINELDSARMRREESRGDRLPEPVDLDEGGIGRVEALEQISMAFLVVLQRLTPAERTVLLLREVFDFDYQEIAALVGRSEAACRKLLERARQHVAVEKPLFAASPEDHRRLLDAFSQAASDGNITALVAMLAQDAVMVTDGGPEGRHS